MAVSWPYPYDTIVAAGHYDATVSIGDFHLPKPAGGSQALVMAMDAQDGTRVQWVLPLSTPAHHPAASVAIPNNALATSHGLAIVCATATGSPSLLADGVLIANASTAAAPPGASTAVIVAVDAATGDVVWATPVLGSEPGVSTRCEAVTTRGSTAVASVACDGSCSVASNTGASYQGISGSRDASVVVTLDLNDGSPAGDMVAVRAVGSATAGAAVVANAASTSSLHLVGTTDVAATLAVGDQVVSEPPPNYGVSDTRSSAYSVHISTPAAEAKSLFQLDGSAHGEAHNVTVSATLSIAGTVTVLSGTRNGDGFLAVYDAAAQAWLSDAATGVDHVQAVAASPSEPGIALVAGTTHTTAAVGSVLGLAMAAAEQPWSGDAPAAAPLPRAFAAAVDTRTGAALWADLGVAGRLPSTTTAFATSPHFIAHATSVAAAHACPIASTLSFHTPMLDAAVPLPCASPANVIDESTAATVTLMEPARHVALNVLLCAGGVANTTLPSACTVTESAMDGNGGLVLLVRVRGQVTLTTGASGATTSLGGSMHGVAHYIVQVTVPAMGVVWVSEVTTEGIGSDSARPTAVATASGQVLVCGHATTHMSIDNSTEAAAAWPGTFVWLASLAAADGSVSWLSTVVSSGTVSDCAAVAVAGNTVATATTTSVAPGGHITAVGNDTDTTIGSVGSLRHAATATWSLSTGAPQNIHALGLASAVTAHASLNLPPMAPPLGAAGVVVSEDEAAVTTIVVTPADLYLTTDQGTSPTQSASTPSWHPDGAAVVAVTVPVAAALPSHLKLLEPVVTVGGTSPSRLAGVGVTTRVSGGASNMVTTGFFSGNITLGLDHGVSTSSASLDASDGIIAVMSKDVAWVHDLIAVGADPGM